MRWIALLMLLPISGFSQTVFLHRLSWDGASTNGYKIYRSVGTNATFYVMATTTNRNITFTNTATGFYRYRVTALNYFGESLPSTERYVDMRRPGAPTNMTLTIEIPQP